MANILKALGRTRAGIDIPPVVVIGLGRFGSSLAHELMANGVEVLGIDSSEKRVREEAPYLTETTSGLTYAVDRFKAWAHSAHITLRRGERSRLADYASEVL